MSTSTIHADRTDSRAEENTSTLRFLIDQSRRSEEKDKAAGQKNGINGFGDVMMAEEDEDEEVDVIMSTAA